MTKKVLPPLSYYIDRHDFTVNHISTRPESDAPARWVIDQSTGERFYYNKVVTVPLDPAIYDGEKPVYSDNAGLAPAIEDKRGINYLHPSKLNDHDKLKIKQFYKPDSNPELTP